MACCRSVQQGSTKNWRLKAPVKRRLSCPSFHSEGIPMAAGHQPSLRGSKAGTVCEKQTPTGCRLHGTLSDARWCGEAVVLHIFGLPR
eukprot:2680692-Amphidinium_carterae.1